MAIRPGRSLRAVANVKFTQDRFDMRFDSRFRKNERFADRLVRLTGGEKAKNVVLDFGELDR